MGFLKLGEVEAFWPSMAVVTDKLYFSMPALVFAAVIYVLPGDVP